MALAAGLLTVLEFVLDHRGLWTWIIVSCAALIVVNTTIAATTDQSIVRRLGREYDSIQSRSVQIVSDLGELTQFDLWMVDLYLFKRNYQFVWRWRFLSIEQVLSRQLSVSLIDARSQPTSVSVTSGPHANCFRSARPVTWFDPSLLETRADNLWNILSQSENERLSREYGVLDLSPLVDHLGRGCVGVLAVHVEPSPDKTLRALGALLSPEGRRRLKNACVELHRMLRK